MPSFDVVSKIDFHEVTNAIDQANREISNRFDFKGTDAKVELSDETITLFAENEFQLKQVDEIMRNKLTKRNIELDFIDYKDPEIKLKDARQTVKLKQGIDSETAKKVVKFIKESKLKVQAAIQGEQLRITGKKRDDLQEVIAKLKEGKWKQPFQYENFRD